MRGTLRGRLAILNSWNPAERSFRLQFPLSPTKPVNCIYRDERLVNELGSGFEGIVEVSGLLHYRRGDLWPHRADVDAITILSHQRLVSLKDLVGLHPLPAGQDSVSYVRSLKMLSKIDLDVWDSCCIIGVLNNEQDKVPALLAQYHDLNLAQRLGYPKCRHFRGCNVSRWESSRRTIETISCECLCPNTNANSRSSNS